MLVVVVTLILLADRRVNPADHNNEAIIRASEYGHVDVVQLLLLDSRVNPAAENNAAILRASGYGRVKVVEALLTDKRVIEQGLDASITIAIYTSWVDEIRDLLYQAQYRLGGEKARQIEAKMKC